MSSISTVKDRTELLKWISEEYQGLNGTHYDVMETSPNALEFSRLVHISRPVLIKNSEAPDAMSRWTDQYLIQKMGNSKISVAVTPNGRADAVTTGPDGKQYFAEPYVQRLTMSSFLAALSSGDSNSREEVRYLQSQNGNMFRSSYFDVHDAEDEPSEFEALREDVPSEIPWCSEALDRPPDAVNLWIGDSASVTSIHSDPYENVYTVIRGAKHFTLLPPTEGWCLSERVYPHSTYMRSPTTNKLVLDPSSSEVPEVRWSSVTDPTVPGALPPEAHPIHITVEAGQTLYLPAGWWHFVRQTQVTIAINYWYDMESRGMVWVWLNTLRGLLEPPSGNDVVESAEHS
ncbi:Clavaminate synthase-like protein [Obba rivulosa]|uniref:Clavaminate synthase-like protein n=1 Tax=Obba rivulosa TaxID=1052685 RepID=A0A8E2DR05_9APHY|nr:Clavaminate synthase-like protein [Obba rivulosa]